MIINKIILPAKNFGDLKSNTTYWIELYDENREGRKIFTIHVKYGKKLKVTNYKEIFEAQIQAIKDLIKVEKELTSENSFILTLFYIPVGVMFFPDLKVMQEGVERKKKLEEHYNICLGGVIGIIDERLLKKFSNLNDNPQAMALLGSGIHLDVAPNLQEAYKVIEDRMLQF